jgi:hypothetical protein
MHRELTRGGFLEARGLGMVGLNLALGSSPRRAAALTGLQGAAQAGTSATYYNDASFDAADPCVLIDEPEGPRL